MFKIPFQKKNLLQLSTVAFHSLQKYSIVNHSLLKFTNNNNTSNIKHNYSTNLFHPPNHDGIEYKIIHSPLLTNNNNNKNNKQENNINKQQQQDNKYSANNNNQQQKQESEDNKGNEKYLLLLDGSRFFSFYFLLICSFIYFLNKLFNEYLMYKNCKDLIFNKIENNENILDSYDLKELQNYCNALQNLKQFILNGNFPNLELLYSIKTLKYFLNLIKNLEIPKNNFKKTKELFKWKCNIVNLIFDILQLLSNQSDFISFQLFKILFPNLEENNKLENNLENNNDCNLFNVIYKTIYCNQLKRKMEIGENLVNQEEEQIYNEIFNLINNLFLNKKLQSTFHQEHYNKNNYNNNHYNNNNNNGKSMFGFILFDQNKFLLENESFVKNIVKNDKLFILLENCKELNYFHSLKFLVNLFSNEKLFFYFVNNENLINNLKFNLEETLQNKNLQNNLQNKEKKLINLLSICSLLYNQERILNKKDYNNKNYELFSSKFGEFFNKEENNLIKQQVTTINEKLTFDKNTYFTLILWFTLIYNISKYYIKKTNKFIIYNFSNNSNNFNNLIKLILKRKVQKRTILVTFGLFFYFWKINNLTIHQFLQNKFITLQNKIYESIGINNRWIDTYLGNTNNKNSLKRKLWNVSRLIGNECYWFTTNLVLYCYLYRYLGFISLAILPYLNA